MKIQKTDGQNKINFQSIHAIKNAEKSAVSTLGIYYLILLLCQERKMSMQTNFLKELMREG